MENTNRWVASTLLVFILLSVSSCFQKFYKTNSISKPPEEILALVESDGKIVIVHYQDTIIQLKDVVVKNDTIWGNPMQLSVNEKYMHPDTVFPNRYIAEDADEVLAQVHLYIKETLPPNNEIVRIESARITRFDIYELDQLATKESRNLGITGFVVAGVATFLAALLIVIAFLELIFEACYLAADIYFKN